MLRLPTKSGDAVPFFALAEVAQAARPNIPLVPASREFDSGHLSRAPPSA
jgi:hypothetical protein